MNTLRIEHLSKHYGSVQALRDVSLTFEPGIYGLLGPNGAGKTTLIRIIATLLKPAGGHVYWNDSDIFSMGERYRALLGYMPQQQNLYRQLTVAQFMDYFAALKGVPKSKRKARIDALLQSVNIDALADRRIGQLSGGMRQRLLIAHALLGNPKLLILDEPTAGLDPAERANLRGIIAALAKNRIILIATHVVSDIEFIAKEVILMKAGVVLAKQDQRSLLHETPVYLSDAPLARLQAAFPDLTLVNTFPGQTQPMYRFITHWPCAAERVQTSLDDVYLDKLT